MLLDLCGRLSVLDETVSAPLNKNAVRLPEHACGEQGYPAYLLAEAFAQIACRAAQMFIPLEGLRYLPASTKSLEVVAYIAADLEGAELMATPVRARPLQEFACSLISSGKTILARATVVVAPAPLPHSPEAAL